MNKYYGIIVYKIENLDAWGRSLAPTRRRPMRVATSLRGVSWAGPNHHQGQAGYLEGAQEWPRENLTRSSTKSEIG